MLKKIRAVAYDLAGMIPSVRRSREAAQQAADEMHRREQQCRQWQLGERSAAALERAMKANPKHATEHVTHKGVGAMYLQKNPQGALGYMIQMYVPDDGSLRDHVVLNFHVNVMKNEVHALWTPYPKPGVGEETHPLDQFEWLLTKACRHATDYRLFVTEGAMGPSFGQFFGHEERLSAVA